MVAEVLHTGTNVRDLTVNAHYITWKWTPLIMGTFSWHRVDSNAVLPDFFVVITIETRYVLSVKRLGFSRTCCNIGIPHRNVNEVGLVITCVRKLDSGLWKIQTWNAIGSSAEISSYYHLIKLHREVFIPNRPRSLLVFVNPYGGKKLAETMFYSTVRPIFELAGIHTKVVVTTHQGHCKNYMLVEDLRSYDGVIAVGGDGLFSELLHGLLYRTRTDAKLPLYKQHKPFSLEVTPRLRIGLIPAGSTNTVVRSIHGTEDVETAAIHIALGAIKWLKLASYKCRIAYLPSSSSTPLDKNTCGSSCPVCLKLDRDHEEATRAPGPATEPHPTTSSLVNPPTLCSQSLHNDLNVEDAADGRNDLLLGLTEAGEGGEESRVEERNLTGGWRVIKGDFVAVNAFLISCRCAKSPLGPAPAAHLGDGFLDLILVRRCSRMQYLRYLVQLTNRRKKRQAQHLRMPFVEAHRVRGFLLQALDRYGDPVAPDEAVGVDTSVWCVDGEVLHSLNIICCVHRQLIRMYGRGPEI
ncbi:Ceramide kinase [Taenia solium]|eukprot:TsM_000771700 transcript=TsM_000771700 gene=TsM_000771700